MLLRKMCVKSGICFLLCILSVSKQTMALTRVVLSKLHEDLPFEEKIELVNKIRKSPHFSAICQKEIIINWILDAIEHFGCTISSQCLSLWSSLLGILNDENNKPSGNFILLKSTSSKIMINSLKGYSYKERAASVIVMCITAFLQTSSVNNIFIYDREALLSLLFAAIDILNKIYESEGCYDESLKEVKNLALTIMDILDSLDHSNKNLKVGAFTEALEDIAAYIYFASDDILSNKLAHKLVSIIFNSQSKSFETLLASDKDVQFYSDQNLDILDFFVSLQKLLCKQITLYCGVPGSSISALLMKKLLSVYLSQDRSGLRSLKVLALFCAVSGFDIPLLITADSCCYSVFQKAVGTHSSLFAVSHLLEVCSFYPQYFNSSSTPENYFKPADWLKGLLTILLDIKVEGNHKCIWLQCFRFLLKITPVVVQDYVTPLIKTCLLNTSVSTKKTRKEYCELFSCLLHVHSQLHQLPKFFVKLLLALTECVKEGSVGKLVRRGRLPIQVLNSVALHVQDLPFGQTIELWKIFSETFTTFGNMTEVFASDKGPILFLALLFSTFLLHAKLFDPTVPKNIYIKFGDLIKETDQEMQENISVLTRTDAEVDMYRRSFLLVCYALGEVKLAYYACSEDALAKSLTLKFPDDVMDFSLLHNFLNKVNSEVFPLHFNGLDKCLSYLIFKLLDQKIRGLILKGTLTDVERDNLKKSICFYMNHLYENLNNVSSWDFDICSLNTDNYGSAIVSKFMKSLPLILNSIPCKELKTFCFQIQQLVMQDCCRSEDCELPLEANPVSVVLTSLNSEILRESKTFQTVFVGTLWKLDMVIDTKRKHDEIDSEGNAARKVADLLSIFDCKWLKYAKTTPKCQNKDMNNLWINLKNICDCLNSMLTQEPLPTVKLKLTAFNIKKLINCLPLEYLFPANQMRCIIGLSFLLFMLPDNHKICEAMPQAEEICGFLSAIFDGVRSVWLFDFVNNGLYLQAVIKTLEKLASKQKQVKDWTWMTQFFSHIINLSARNVESLMSLEDCLSKLEINLENKVTILVICVLQQELAKIIQRAYLQDDYKRKIESIASVTCSHIVKCLKYNSSELPDDQMYSLLINSYMETLEIMTSASCHFDKNKKHECLELLPNIFKNVLEILQGQVSEYKDVYLQFISKICTHNKELDSCVPEDFKVLAWKTMFLYFKEKVELIKESNLKSSLQDVSTKNLQSYTTPKSSDNRFCKHVCPKYVYDSSTNPNLLATSHLIRFHLNESEKNVLKSLSSILTQEELNAIFQEMMNEMDNYEIALLDVLYLQLKLEIIKSLIEVDYSQHFSSFSSSLQKCASFLHCIVNEACDSTVCLHLVKFPVLEFLHFILKQEKIRLPRQCAIQFLHSCACIELNKQGRELITFIRCFNSVWDIVYNLLIHYPEVVLTITADYLSFVTNLLKSLVVIGDQDNIRTCSKDIQQDIHLCSQNMDRLLTVIARHKTEFCKLVPYIIADYVDSIQHVTLDSVIKSFLVSGINRLLDICNEDALKMLSVNINHSCREIFKNLVKNYKQYKYSGQI